MQIPRPSPAPVRGSKAARGAAGLRLRHLLIALVVAVRQPPLAASGVVTWHAAIDHRLASVERLQ